MLLNLGTKELHKLFRGLRGADGSEINKWVNHAKILIYALPAGIEGDGRVAEQKYQHGGHQSYHKRLGNVA